MIPEKVISDLHKQYPILKPISIPSENPTEMIWEVDPTSLHTDSSIAVAAIDISEEHYHIKSKETYRVKKGALQLWVNGMPEVLNEGETYTIQPPALHYAEGIDGEVAVVEVESHPGWTPEDHILLKEKMEEINEEVDPLNLKGRPFGITHADFLTKKGEEVCDKEHLNKMILLPATKGHDSGYAGMKVDDYRTAEVKIEHMRRGVEYMRKILEKVEFPEIYREPILYLIGHHDDWALGNYDVYKGNIYLAVLADLDFLYLASKEGFEQVRGDMNRNLEESREKPLSPKDMIAFLKGNKKHVMQPWATETTRKMFEELIRERERELIK